MRVRLTHISLKHDGVHHKVGAVVTEEHLPASVLAARIEGGTAELVLDDGEVRPELAEALAAYLDQARSSATAIGAVLALTDDASPAELDAVAETFEAAQQIFLSMPGLARLDEIRDQILAAKAQEAFGSRQTISSGAEQAAAPAEGEGSTSAAASSDNPADEGGVDDDPAAVEAAAGEPAPAAKSPTPSKAKTAPKAAKAGAAKTAGRS